jgi:glycosyltransferase involved in cell wall biosynthesis
MKSIKIVSSYSESCGNAYFTDVLLNGVRALGFGAECASLDLTLTQSVEWKIRKKADAHIDEMARFLKKADGVNIQFEAGLYGTIPSDIVKRFKSLATANKNTSVTLHSPRLIGASSDYRESIRMLLRGRLIGAVNAFMSAYKNGIHHRLNGKIVSFCVKYKLPIIVHTNRAKEQIKMLFDYDDVHVHPLKFVHEARVVNLDKLKSLKAQYNLIETDKIIGMFGYVSAYKGHTAALQAMTRLPEDYKLIIFGRVHPQTIVQGAESDKYINFLCSYIDVNKLNERVFFVGEVETEDFIDYAATVDFVWLPYLEVGQDGSGIASICCDVSNNVLASNAFSFDELMRLIPYKSVRRFDIGNTVELAQKTMSNTKASTDDGVKNSKYSVTTQAELYSMHLKG